MKKLLLATVALTGMALSAGSAQAVVLVGTFADNDCAGVFGIGANCNTGGTFTTVDNRTVTLNNTPLIAKLNPNGSVDQLGLFPSITGAEFSITNTGQGTLNYTYNPTGLDPAIQYVVVKGGDFFNVFSFTDGSNPNAASVFAPLNPNNQNRFGTSHISFYDTVIPVTVPEPMSLALFGAGLLGLGMVRRKATPNPA
jgi:hypothetical protein